MMKKDPVWALVLFYIISAALVIGCAAVFGGCSVLKKSHSAKESSVIVSKDDTTSVSLSDVYKTTEGDYWRNTFLLPGWTDQMYQNVPLLWEGLVDTVSLGNLRSDTVRLQPHYTTQPIVYIQEGGKYKTAERSINYDSVRRVITDSLGTSIVKETTASKTKVLDVWQIIAICIGGSFILNTLASNFTIKRR